MTPGVLSTWSALVGHGVLGDGERVRSCGWALLAGACTAAAVLLALPAPGPARLTRLSGAVGRPVGPPRGVDRWWGAVRRRLRRQQELAAVRASVLELCEAFGAELRAGRSPVEALRAAVPPRGAGTSTALEPLLPLLAVTAEDAPRRLEAVAAQPGCGGLRQLAVCWRVAQESGAALADAVDRTAARQRGDERQRQEVAVLLAGPRATAHLLAALPAVGILLGRTLGADPLHVLLASAVGRACGAAGVVLAVLGWVWTARMASAAVPP